ncbi:MAG: type II toxin-antitoxin system VapC family toxin [Thiobacillaceae bacterium]
MIYLDTSAAIPMFVPEPASDAVDAWFEACDEPLISADWILTEFASALSIKVRRGELKQGQAQMAWKDFENFSRSGLRLIPVSRQAFEHAAQLARHVPSGLRSGDSLHLAMAIEARSASIATADGNLEKNAKAKGLAVKRF